MADMEAVEKLKGLLGVTDGDKDLHVEFALEHAEDIVKNYCNIGEIPAGLNSTVFRMAAELYRNEQYGESGVPQTVKSISEGDTSTSFGTIETTGYAQSLLKDYKKQLNRYRKVVF